MLRSSLVLALSLTSLAWAQGGSGAVGRRIVLGPAEQHPTPPDRLDLRTAPGLQGPPGISSQPSDPLPVGVSQRPQPSSPPTALVVSGGTDLPCDPLSHLNTIVRPTGASIHTVAESSLALAGATLADSDTAFYTGNQFAGLSLDGGRTWTHVDPYTRFPQLDGGFCCDQRTLYVPSRDITLWSLQYWPSAARGSTRLAVAVGRAGLRANAWHSYVITPQPFGFPTGWWFDFPDLASSDHHLYVSLNVITPTPWQNVDSLVLKLPLDELRAGANLNATFWTRSATLGPGRNYRFAQGSTGTMYFASHLDTATMRLFRNPDASGALTFTDRAVAGWSAADNTYVSFLSNGVNWADRALPFIKGGYANDREYGFLWHAGTQPGRPQPYVRVARFSTADHALIGEEDIWSPGVAWLYPAATSNAVGHVGAVLAAGGPAQHPLTAVLIVDDCQPTFAGGPAWTFAASTQPPSYAGWGDYFSMQPHPARTLTFLTSGLAMVGVDQAPRFLHYGRARDQLGWTSVIVRSAGVSGVPVGVSPIDQLGRGAVTTPSYASYAAAAGATLTAPATHAAGGRVFEFRQWRHRSSPTGAWVSLPPGQRACVIAALGDDDDTAEALYAERVPGAAARFGAGCTGSNGRVPDHFTRSVPETGRPFTWEVTAVFGATPAYLLLGWSNTTWNGQPLPRSLGPFGADPGCVLLVSADVLLPVAIDPSGSGALTLGIPDEPVLIGFHVFTQVLVIDPAVPSPTKIIVTNGLDATVGGLRPG